MPDENKQSWTDRWYASRWHLPVSVALVVLNGITRAFDATSGSELEHYTLQHHPHDFGLAAAIDAHHLLADTDTDLLETPDPSEDFHFDPAEYDNPYEAQREERRYLSWLSHRHMLGLDEGI